MSLSDTLKWQWEGYNKYHKSRINLWVHIFAVPVFILATFSLVNSIINLNVFLLICSIILMLVSIVMQGIGHKKEEIPTVPFTGVKNAVVRILLEQLYTFPKFVISGKWFFALRNQ